MIYWNPPSELMRLPILDLPITWYGCCWIVGFAIAYQLFVPMVRSHLFGDDTSYQRRLESQKIADRLLWYILIAALVGARVGHIVFYDLEFYLTHPGEIVKTWHGGLASHGGAAAVFFSVWLFARQMRSSYPRLHFLVLIDLVAICTPLVGAFIRLGNFINQEILGTPSSLPWAVVFGRPIDGSLPLARHPVQLYEGAGYLVLFFFLYVLWQRGPRHLGTGYFAGLFFILLFTIRIICEFFKESQGSLLNESYLSSGQLLSIPFILVGLFLYCNSRKGVQPSYGNP